MAAFSPPLILRRFLFLLTALLSLAFAEIPAPAHAAEAPPPYVTSNTILRYLTHGMTDIQNAGDGSQRLFIVDKEGTIRIVKNGGVQYPPFLDLNDRVLHSRESGLLGLAFPPDHASERCFYVCYMHHSGDMVVSRFRLTDSPDVADLASEEILLRMTAPHELKNLGGQIAFGPDGYLYISTGDTGMPSASQDLTRLEGKILRVDVNHSPEDLPYAIPPTNPHAEGTERRPEIIAWGLRNPWRFSIDPATGDLYIGDVGEDLREEINFMPAQDLGSGINFGWPFKEGTLDGPDQTQGPGDMSAPVFEYDRSSGSCVIGGCVYRGTNPKLRGLYLFGDHVTGKIWAMDKISKQVQPVLDTAHSIMTFGQDEAGNIYYASASGQLHLLDAPQTLPPPRFTPPPGLYANQVSFGIETDVPDAIIRFTTDGSVPDENSPIHPPGSLVTFTKPGQAHAVLFRNGHPPSAVAGGDYKLCPSWVQFHPPQTNESYFDTLPVSLACATPGVEIFYTTDGSEPGPESKKYIPGQPVPIVKASVIKAQAYKTGWEPSGLSQSRYNLYVSPSTWVDPWVDLDEPVDLTSKTPGATIHYTLDGSTPTPSSPVWTGPRHLADGTLVRTFNTRGELDPSLSEQVVRQISSTPVVFQKLARTPLYPADVACMPDGSIYAAVYSNIYLIAGGTATPMIPDSSYTIHFNSITTTSDSKLATTQGSNYGIRKYSSLDFSTTEGAGTPHPVWDTAAEPGGGLVYTSLFNHRVGRIDPTGRETPVAGTGTAGSADGPAGQATFNGPNGIARDASGRIFVSERYGNKIRVIGPDAKVTTYAGTGAAGWKDGPAAFALFDCPRSMVMDRIGNLYLSEDGNSGSRIRKITPDGFVSTLRGPSRNIDGTIASPDGVTVDASGLAVDDNGVIYLSGDYHISKVVQEDWDNDGIPDVTETLLGPPFVVGTDERDVDSDGDRFSNAAERIAGTNPSSASSKPEGPSIRKLEENQVSIHFPMTPGGTRQLEYSDDMITWKPTGLAKPGTLESFTSRVKISPSIPGRFYRVREER